MAVLLTLFLAVARYAWKQNIFHLSWTARSGSRACPAPSGDAASARAQGARLKARFARLALCTLGSALAFCGLGWEPALTYMVGGKIAALFILGAGVVAE